MATISEALTSLSPGKKALLGSLFIAASSVACRLSSGPNSQSSVQVVEAPWLSNGLVYGTCFLISGGIVGLGIARRNAARKKSEQNVFGEIIYQNQPLVARQRQEDTPSSSSPVKPTYNTDLRLEYADLQNALNSLNTDIFIMEYTVMDDGRRSCQVNGGEYANELEKRRHILLRQDEIKKALRQR